MSRAHESHHNGHAPASTQAGVTRDLLQKHATTGPMFRLAVVVFTALFILGIIGFIMRLSGGTGNTPAWGYYAAMFAYLLTTVQAAPMVAVAPRLARAHWRRPISRAAELWAVGGLFNLLLFIPLLWVLPSLENGRRSLWFFTQMEGVPAYSPHIWTTLAILALVATGLMLLWLSSMPDFAIVRDQSTGARQRLFARLAWGWRGTTRQWHMLHHRIGILGAFYFMMLVFVHFLVSVDFLMALVPGWIDALFPATHAANALQAATATMVLTMFFLRRFGGYRDYIGLDQFWGLGKLMFALSLLWFWFWFSSFIILWYGKKENETAVLELFISGVYQPAFMATFILNFVVPLFTMVWNPVRKSIWGPTIIACSVLLGTFFDRIRLYVGGYSVAPQSSAHVIDPLPLANLPDLADVFIIIGALAGPVLFYLLASRLFPPVNIWEQRELLLYRLHKPFHRTQVMVLGKPE